MNLLDAFEALLLPVKMHHPGVSLPIPFFSEWQINLIYALTTRFGERTKWQAFVA